MENLSYIKNNLSPVIIVGEIDIETIIIKTGAKRDDLLVVNKSPILINDIRELIHFLSLKPLGNNIKIVLVNNIENITSEAANAFLKILEEPPVFARLILTTTDDSKILPTILSRCQKYRLKPISNFEVPENYLDPKNITKLSYSERFKWVTGINEEDWLKIILLWQQYFRGLLLEGKSVLPILNDLGKVRDLLQTNISVKLNVENLIINFDKYLD